jgi:hypothetical protein
VNNRGRESARLYRPNFDIDQRGYVLFSTSAGLNLHDNAGTNDAMQNRGDSEQEPVSTTHIRMEQMILELFSILGENPVIILSTLAPNMVSQAARDNVITINNNYRALSEKLAGQGRKVILAEMNDGRFINETLIHYNIHPIPSKARSKSRGVWEDGETSGPVRPASIVGGSVDVEARLLRPGPMAVAATTGFPVRHHRTVLRP